MASMTLMAARAVSRRASSAEGSVARDPRKTTASGISMRRLDTAVMMSDGDLPEGS